MKLTPTKRVAVGLLAAALPLSMAACTKGASSSSGGAGGELTMWTHNAGNKAELAAITAIVNDYNASQKKYKVKIQAFPQDSYNQSVVAAAASKKLPVHPRHRRPERAELGLGRLPRPARGHGRHAVEVPADGARQVQQQDVLLRLLRRRARHGHAQDDPRQVRHPRPDHRPAVDEGRVHRGAEEDQGLGRLREPARHRDELHRRVVALRVLPDAAELRRRPHQPRRTTRAPRACSTAPRRSSGRRGSAASSPTGSSR